MNGNRYLNQQQKDALERIWWNGLTKAQKQIVNALDAHDSEFPDGFTIHDIMELTGLSYRAVHTYLPVLDFLGYITVQRKHTGRIYPRGTIFNFGFDLSEIDYE